MEYIEVQGSKFPKVSRNWANLQNGKIPHVLCPFCNHYHNHGIGDDPQHVHAQCVRPYKEYVTADDGILLYQSRGYVIVDYNKPK
jgi:hypothetical protein